MAQEKEPRDERVNDPQGSDPTQNTGAQNQNSPGTYDPKEGVVWSRRTYSADKSEVNKPQYTDPSETTGDASAQAFDYMAHIFDGYERIDNDKSEEKWHRHESDRKIDNLPPSGDKKIPDEVLEKNDETPDGKSSSGKDVIDKQDKPAGISDEEADEINEEFRAMSSRDDDKDINDIIPDDETSSDKKNDRKTPQDEGSEVDLSDEDETRRGRPGMGAAAVGAAASALPDSKETTPATSAGDGGKGGGGKTPENASAVSDEEKHQSSDRDHGRKPDDEIEPEVEPEDGDSSSSSDEQDTDADSPDPTGDDAPSNDVPGRNNADKDPSASSTDPNAEMSGEQPEIDGLDSGNGSPPVNNSDIPGMPTSSEGGKNAPGTTGDGAGAAGAAGAAGSPFSLADDSLTLSTDDPGSDTPGKPSSDASGVSGDHASGVAGLPDFKNTSSSPFDSPGKSPKGKRDGDKDGSGDGKPGDEGADSGAGDGKSPGTEMSPFDDGNYLPGGGGVDPSKNSGAMSPFAGVPGNDDDDGSGDDGSGQGGKGTGGGTPPPLPPGGVTSTPGGMGKIVAAIALVIAMVGGLVVSMIVGGTATQEQEESSRFLGCAIDTQGDSFRSGVRGVPDGEYAKPVLMPPAVVTSGPGPRWGTNHEGLDIAWHDGTDVFAFYDGVVSGVYRDTDPNGYGSYVIINHMDTPDGEFDTLYGHMWSKDVKVEEGDELKAGERFTAIGNNGQSTGPHLHFEIHQGGYRNPFDGVEEWVENATNPGHVENTQSTDSDGAENDAEDASASSSERVLQSSYAEQNAESMTHASSSLPTASSVQKYGDSMGRNPNRTLIITSEDYSAPGQKGGLDQFVTHTMKETNVHYLDNVYYDNSGSDPYHRGRWEGPYGPGMTFIPAAKDIYDAERGYQEVIDYLNTTEENGLKVYENYGKIVVAISDSKRYKPDPMPVHPQPGPKPHGFVPHPDNWIDPGWPGLLGGWIPNHQYLPEAAMSYPEQHDTAKGVPVHNGGGWSKVAEDELAELKKLLEDNDVDLYLVTGAGQYAFTPEGKDARTETTGTNNNYILNGPFDEENIVRWDEYFDEDDLYRPGDNPERTDTRKYRDEVGGLNEDGAQKFVDSIRTVAWNEDRAKLPAGNTSVKAGDKKLPGTKYKSPYRESGRGSGKIDGYEGGYKITNGDKLTHDAMTVAQAIQENFPEIQVIGGWRPSDPYPDHPSGRAVDIMIPDYKSTRGKNLGKEINEYLLDNHEWFNIEYSIWAQEYFPAGGSSSKMEDRGSDTQNHFDHVHVTVKEPANKNQGDAKGAKADESYYYGEFPGRDGSPANPARNNGMTQCCPTANRTGNSDAGNFRSEGNIIDPSDVVARNSALVIEAGEELGFTENEIITALMVASRESNFLNYANDGANWAQSGSSNVPPEVLRESLDYPHDAVGHDAASVGIFQQQVLYWGTVEDLMIPAYQTGQFYAEMRRLNAGEDGYDLGHGKDRGLAGSTIQVNRDGRGDYDGHEGLAEDLYASYKDNQDKPLSNRDKEHLKRGWDNRRVMMGAEGESPKEGQGDKSTATSNLNARNTADRSLNGGCGVSGSIRRHNQVKYDEGDANTIVQAALDQAGVPYSWGGGTVDGPSEGFDSGAGIVGFDCSGLTMYAAAQAGITIPRTTGGQIEAGKRIGSLEDAKPGDLIFWPGHVAIYMGDDKIIHAPQTGDVVREADMYDHGNVTGIRRIAE